MLPSISALRTEVEHLRMSQGGTHQCAEIILRAITSTHWLYMSGAIDRLNLSVCLYEIIHRMSDL